MPRTDIHSPLNLITEDYEYVACGNFSTGTTPAYSPLIHEARYLIDQGWTFGENHSAGGCYHCGAHLIYYAILKHIPSHTLITVGETCLDNRFERSSADFHALRQRAQLDREAQRIVTARAAWFAADPSREEAYEWATERVNDGDYGYEGMRHSFVHKINLYGSTSDKFVAAIHRDRQRTAEREAQRAAEQADASPVVEGKITLRGEIVSLKWRESAYGGCMKMLLKEERGFKVWGTVPASLDSAQKGDTVQFDGTVTASSDDPTFGFFKRPTKGVILATAALVAA